MDQAILVALVMLVCVLTMLVLGIPISISIGLASTIAMLFVRMPWEQRHRRYLQASIPSHCWQYPFSYWRGIS